ncbi:MAG: hypothetical protein DME96_04555 [Verrucomicrobia bacterium]|nr:MAG: hypothetical protein DME96_04555 [Verrucomicrobiota bacterium]
MAQVFRGTSLAAMTMIIKFLPPRYQEGEDIFARDHVLAFVMSIFIRFDEGFRCYLVCAL